MYTQGRAASLPVPSSLRTLLPLPCLPYYPSLPLLSSTLLPLPSHLSSTLHPVLPPSLPYAPRPSFLPLPSLSPFSSSSSSPSLSASLPGHLPYL